MHLSSPAELFCLSMLPVMLVTLGIRALLLEQVARIDGSKEAGGELPPGELAYLLRGGDMVHTVVVIAVDLIHRFVKSNKTDDAAFAMLPYESAIWDRLKDSVISWRDRSTAELTQSLKGGGFGQWFKRVGLIKRYVANVLSAFVKTVTKDPRNLRKYFSISMVSRVALELWSSGGKERIEDVLLADLRARGLIVAESRRKRFAGLLAALTAVAVGASAAVAVAFVQLGLMSVAVPVGVAIVGLPVAILLRVLLFVPHLVPFYDEFAQVAKDAARYDIRFEVLRLVLGIARFVVRTILCFVIVVAVLAGSWILHAGFGQAIEPAIWLCVTGIVLSFAFIQLILDQYKLVVNECPSTRAVDAVKLTKNRMASTSPLACFRETLTDGEYNRSFSDIVAIYGIDTLWLLS